MRIRKRPRPAAVEVARAAPAFENKPENAPKSLHAEVQITHSSERLDGGSVEPSAVVVSEKNEVLQNGKTTTTTEEEEPGDGDGTTDLLMKSLLVVFERAGTRGLTAREAVAKLVEYELPGLQEGERSSVQVAKVLRTPDFVHIEDGKYFIYPSTPHAVVAESSTQSEPSQQPVLQPRLDINLNLNTVPNLNHRRKRAPVKTTTSTSTVAAASYSETSELSDKVPEEKIELKKRRRRPPSSQHELAIGPRQCKRYDGRGWQCTRETEEGFSFCEHHQALMNKRTLRLNLAKKRRATNPDQVDVEQHAKAAAAAATTTSTHENGGAGGGGSIAATTTTTSRNNNTNLNNKEQPTAAAPYGIEDLIHNQRRRLVKARSLKSIK